MSNEHKKPDLTSRPISAPKPPPLPPFDYRASEYDIVSEEIESSYAEFLVSLDGVDHKVAVSFDVYADEDEAYISDIEFDIYTMGSDKPMALDPRTPLAEKIDEIISEYVQEHGYDYHQSNLEYQADMAYETWRDNQMERGDE